LTLVAAFWKALATARRWEDANAWRFHWHRFSDYGQSSQAEGYVICTAFGRVGETIMPDELPFEPIKLNSPPGASPPFPSEIRSIQDAKDFVNTYVDVPKRDTLRWRLTIAALNGDPGSYTNVQLVLRNALDEEGWLGD
jgi:hypothetical protein